MKKKNKLHLRKKRNTLHPHPVKVSEMIINYAGDYIGLGETIEKKQSYLNIACIAWNISLLDKPNRAIAIVHLLSEYEANNPECEDTDNVLHDLNLLIEVKLRLYPTKNFSIVNAEIINNDGKERIIVTTFKKNK